MTENEIKQKILSTGVFKLDDRSNPIGIIKFTSKKVLSTKAGNYINHKPHKLKNLISDLSYEMVKYCRGPEDRNLLENFKDDFEKKFISFLEDWGFSPDDLNPHYAELIKKAKKNLDRELSGHAKNIERLRNKDTARRGTMIYWMHRAFKEYTQIKPTDINRYLAYILIACGLENGSPKTVFNKIDRAYHRHPKSE